MHDPLDFAGTKLNRLSDKRTDKAWLSGQQSFDHTKVLLVWRDLTLVSTNAHLSGPAVLPVTGNKAKNIFPHSNQTVFLGQDQNIAKSYISWFGVDISHLTEDEALQHSGHGDAQFLDLRDVASHFMTLSSPETMARAAYVRGMMHWHRQHQFCGACGHPTVSDQGGHVRCCENPDCAKSHFPRTDPAVIMLVESIHPETGTPVCLLGRSPAWLEGQYSTLAGFVEPGESLVEAVVREVFEEVGVVVDNVDYSGAQPWPFPGSLMLGFIAQAKYQDITIDENEIADARWFTADDIKKFNQWGDDEPSTFKLPRPISISRTLIDDWLKLRS